MNDEPEIIAKDLSRTLARLADNTDDQTFMFAHRELFSCGLGKNGALCKECEMMSTLLTTLRALKEKRKLPLIPE